MRKAAILLALLLALSVGGACFAASGVYAARDQVVLTETAVYGDRAAAQGLSVQRRTGYDGHLFWDTAYDLDTDPRTQTVYSFSASKVREERPHTYSAVDLQVDPEAGWEFDFDSPEPPAGFGRAYWELYQAVAPGEEKSAVVDLKDYIDYYPLYVELDFPGTQCSTLWWEEADEPEPDAGTQRYAIRKIQEFFRIPVLQGDRRSISVGRHENGNASHMGSSTEGDFFSMGTYSVLTGDACYFTFDAHSGSGRVVDTGEIPGGYGIYRLPYAHERHDASGQKICGVDADGLEMVYPLDPDIALKSLHVDPAQTRLLLYAVEEGKTVLTVIDLETMDTLQKLELADGDVGGTLYDEGDFLVAVLTGTEKQLAVISAGEDSYTLEFVCDISPNEELDLWFGESAWEFDGERLAFAIPLEDAQGNWRWRYGPCGFCLGVYEQSGLVYCGEYRSSLDTGAEMNTNYYTYYCHSRDPDPLAISWQK